MSSVVDLASLLPLLTNYGRASRIDGVDARVSGRQPRTISRRARFLGTNSAARDATAPPSSRPARLSLVALSHAAPRGCAASDRVPAADEFRVRGLGRKEREEAIRGARTDHTVGRCSMRRASSQGAFAAQRRRHILQVLVRMVGRPDDPARAGADLSKSPLEDPKGERLHEG